RRRHRRNERLRRIGHRGGRAARLSAPRSGQRRPADARDHRVLATRAVRSGDPAGRGRGHAHPAPRHPRRARGARVSAGSIFRRLLGLLAYPESIAFVLLLAAFVAGATLSPYFLDARYLLESTSLYMEIGVLALAMTFVIISGNIDLSVASNLALTAVISAKLFAGLHLP